MRCATACHARPGARLEAQELLGDGDAAGLGELGAGEQCAGSPARRAPWPGRPSGTAPTRWLTGNGATRSTARSNITAPWSGRTARRCPSTPRVAQIGREFEQAAAALRGTGPAAEVAMLHDYDSRWAIDFQPHSSATTTPSKCCSATTGRCATMLQSVDIVSADAPLAITDWWWRPSLNVIPDDLARAASRLCAPAAATWCWARARA